MNLNQLNFQGLWNKNPSSRDGRRGMNKKDLQIISDSFGRKKSYKELVLKVTWSDVKVTWWDYQYENIESGHPRDTNARENAA